MFKLFKERPHDVKSIRNIIVQFIKEKLQRAQGGEGANIMGVYIFINCSDAEKHLYEASVFANVPGKFKLEEVQRIADDYAITLSPSFKLPMAFKTSATSSFFTSWLLTGEIVLPALANNRRR